MTITPSALPNLTASVDYYRIELDDAIGTMPGAFLFNQCQATGDPLFCSQIRRTSLGALTGSSVASGGYILQTAINTGEAQITGVDPADGLHARSSATADTRDRDAQRCVADEAIATPAPGLSYDCAGLFGTICQTVNPEWRHNLRLTWSSPWDLDVSLQWRYIGSTKLDQNDSDPDLHFALWGEFDGFNDELPDMSYVDLSAPIIYHTLEIRTDHDLAQDADSTTESRHGLGNTYPTYTRSEYSWAPPRGSEGEARVLLRRTRASARRTGQE